MQTQPADPRTTRREQPDPTYRVVFWHPMPAPPHVPHDRRGWGCTELDVTGADVVEVLAWIEERMHPDERFTLSLVATLDGEPGLIRLVGWDPTDPSPRGAPGGAPLP